MIPMPKFRMKAGFEDKTVASIIIHAHDIFDAMGKKKAHDFNKKWRLKNAHVGIEEMA